MRSILILAALMVLASMTPAQAKDRYLLGSSAYAQSVTVGARKLYPATIDENQAMAAAAEGSGLWVPLPEGGRTYLKFVKTEVYANGDWSWIGQADTAIGKQPVVLTFGKDAVFGTIPTPSGRALHVVRHEGKAWLAQVDPALAAQSVALMASAVRRNDALAPPVSRMRGGQRTRMQSSEEAAAPLSAASAQVTASATATSGPVVDLMIAYTSGFATGLGSDSAAQTRLNYLVAYANQSYVNSKVNLRVRLVKTVKVSYPDNTLNDDALFDLSGFDDSGNSVTIPPALSTLPNLRVQYGADLVALVRKYDHATNGSCGIAWLNGAGAVGVTQDDYPAGMAVVSDGSSSGFFCEDKSLTHELGHTMGLAHDIANASKDSNNNPIPGAYAYSYGYKTSVSGNTGFGTIMAYEDQSQESVQVFSNPSLLCQNVPCGVSNQADNARTLNQTGAVVATFEPTKVGLTSDRARNDLDGDGMSDLLWRNANGRFAYWTMFGATAEFKSSSVAVSTSYALVAAGDFTGDGKVTDLVWANSSSIWLWPKGGTSSGSQRIGDMPAGWAILGSGDIDGDGKSDLLWRQTSTGRFAYWLMSGATVRQRSASTAVDPSYALAAIADFNGDGKTDLVWTNGIWDWMWLSTGTGFTAQRIGSHPAGWTIAGGGDVDGDGKADLLWRNGSAGTFTYWLMNGSTVRSKASSLSMASSYRLLTYGDFNGDGLLDLVWSNSSVVQMWVGSDQGFLSQQVTSRPSGWNVIDAPGL